MHDRTLSFENRWTSGKQARHWILRLEREGETNIRAMYVEHELRSPDTHLLFEDVPAGFVHDWLAWCENRKRQRRQGRHRMIVGLLGVAILLIILLVWWVGSALSLADV